MPGMIGSMDEACIEAGKPRVVALNPAERTVSGSLNRVQPILAFRNIVGLNEYTSSSDPPEPMRYRSTPVVMPEKSWLRLSRLQLECAPKEILCLLLMLKSKRPRKFQ